MHITKMFQNHILHFLHEISLLNELSLTCALIKNSNLCRKQKTVLHTVYAANLQVEFLIILNHSM